MRIKNVITEFSALVMLKNLTGAAVFCLVFAGNIFAQTAPKYTLFVEKGVLSVNGAGGATIDVWGYTTASGGAPMIPGPVLEASEGETFTVRVINHHNQNHNFVIDGTSGDTTPIPAGGTRDFTVTASAAGNFLYHDTLNSQINQSMGLYGALVVRPSNTKSAWTNGPMFNQERLWVFSDMDKAKWNDIASFGGFVDTSIYKPNYFLLNGQGGFDAMHDPNSVIDGYIDETFLVRVVNAGQYSQTLHFHGAHFQVISRNGVNLSTPEWQDTSSVKAGETAMILYKLRSGIFPMHSHTSQMETANGVYLNGCATLIVGK